MGRSNQIELSQDAAVVTTLAGTAMSFSHSAEDQAERWLRALRLNGTVGTALQALGVGEAPLATAGEASATKSPPLGDDTVDLVIKLARQHAGERGAALVSTADLLFALLEVYGEPMDNALQARGASSQELLQFLAASSVSAAEA